MARRPAAWTHSHTAWALTDPALSHRSHLAAVAHGTKTASAQPRDWSASLVRCYGRTPSAASNGAPGGVAQPWGHRPTRRRHQIGPHRLST